MKVIATKLGYFGKLRQPGDEFDVPDGTKGSWFQPVEKMRGKKSSATDAPDNTLDAPAGQ